MKTKEEIAELAKKIVSSGMADKVLHRYDGESEDSQQMRRYYTGLLDYMPIVTIPAQEYGSSGTSNIQVMPDVRSIRRSDPEDSLGTSILEKEYERIADEQGTQAAQEYARRQGAIGAGAAVGSALAGGLAAEGALTSAVTGGLDYLRPSKIPEMVYHAFRPGASGLLKAMPYYSGATTLGGALADTALDSYFALEGGRNLGKTGSVPGEILNAMNFIPLIAPVYNAGRMAYNAGKRAYNYGKRWWDFVVRGNTIPYDEAAGRIYDAKKNIATLLDEFNSGPDNLRNKTDAGQMIEAILPYHVTGTDVHINEAPTVSKTEREPVYFLMPDGTVEAVPLETHDIGHKSSGEHEYLIEYIMPGEHPAAKAGDFDAIDPGDIGSIPLDVERGALNPGLSERAEDMWLESVGARIPYPEDIPVGSVDDALVTRPFTNDQLVWSRGSRLSANDDASLVVQKGAAGGVEAVKKQVADVRGRLGDSGTVVGSSLFYEQGLLSGTPHDTEILTTKSRLNDATAKMEASIHTDKGVAKGGKSKYAANNEVDYQIIDETPDGEATGKLAWELFRTMHPLEYERQAAHSLETSTHFSDQLIYKPDGTAYTADELLDEFNTGGYALQNAVNDAMSIMKDQRGFDKSSQLKHNRPMAFLTDRNDRTKKLVRTAIDTMGQSQLGADYMNGSAYYKNIDFGDIDANKKLLKHLGLSESFADDPDMMKNIFDYWYLQQSVQKRGVTGAKDKAEAIAWATTSNFPRGGGDYSGAGRNTSAATAFNFAFSYPQVGVSQVHPTSDPERIKNVEGFMHALDRLDESYKFKPEELEDARNYIELVTPHSAQDIKDEMLNVLSGNDVSVEDISDRLRQLVYKGNADGWTVEEIENAIGSVAFGLDLPFIKTGAYGGDYRGVLQSYADAASGRYFDFKNTPNINTKPYEFGRPVEGYADRSGYSATHLNKDEVKKYIPAQDEQVRQTLQAQLSPPLLYGEQGGMRIGDLRPYDIQVKDYRPMARTLLREMLDNEHVYREAKEVMESYDRMPGVGWRRGREMKKQTKALEEFLKDTSKRRSVELGLDSADEYNELIKWMPDDINPEDIVLVQKRPGGGYYVETKSKRGIGSGSGGNDGWVVMPEAGDPVAGVEAGLKWEYDLPFANGGFLRRFDTGGAMPISPVGQYSPLPLYPFALPEVSVVGPAAVPVIDARKDAARRIRAVENSKKNPNGGWNEKEQRWYPHASYEGGADTIAYGIKLSNGSPEAKLALKQGYLTDEQANSAVDTLVDKYYNAAQKVYDKKYGAGEWDKLSDWSQSILTDYSYNPGLAKFPSLMEGFHSGDMDKILANYKRYSGGKPLGRNKILLSEIQQLNDVYPIFRAGGGKIHINPANRGKFNETKRRTGKTTEELTHSSNPLTRKRAIFAQNAAKWNHKHADGGIINRMNAAYSGDTAAMLDAIQRIKEKRNG